MDSVHGDGASGSSNPLGVGTVGAEPPTTKPETQSNDDDPDSDGNHADSKRTPASSVHRLSVTLDA
jgi:hypothetical protein